MKDWLGRHKGKVGAALTLGAGAAATYYAGPMAGDAARQYVPAVLGWLGGLF
jgi:hypothetical protein